MRNVVPITNINYIFDESVLSLRVCMHVTLAYSPFISASHRRIRRLVMIAQLASLHDNRGDDSDDNDDDVYHDYLLLSS